MPDVVGSVVGGAGDQKGAVPLFRATPPEKGVRPLFVALCLILTVARGARAQQPEVTTPPAAPEFLSHYDFHLNAAALGSGDSSFLWDARFGGALDLVDYVTGRLTFVGDYQAVLGNEYRSFDPNQSIYTLEGSASRRVGATEVVVMFHHVSRHLSDRTNRLAVAWNEVGVRVLRQSSFGGTTVDLDLEGGRVVARAFVDYTWAGEVNVLVRRTLTDRAALFARGMGKMFAVDGSVPLRGTQTGGSGEVGVRLTGRGAAMELFAGVEKRLDASPLDRESRHWALAGFRLLSR